MALPAAPGVPVNPATLPKVGSPTGAPPAGPLSATQPSPNRGLQAQGLSQVQWAVRLLERALPSLGVETEVGKDVMQALTRLSKHIPAGSTSPGVDNSALSQITNQARQESPMLALLRAKMMGAQPGAGAGAGAGPTPTPTAA